MRYVGEPVAAVIAQSAGGGRGRRPATSRWTGSRCPRWRISFAAMADGAPQLFDDAPKNIEHENTIKAGDPDAAFKAPTGSSSSA